MSKEREIPPPFFGKDVRRFSYNVARDLFMAAAIAGHTANGDYADDANIRSALEWVDKMMTARNGNQKSG